MPPKKRKAAKRKTKRALEVDPKRAKEISMKQEQFQLAVMSNDVESLLDVITGDGAIDVNTKPKGMGYPPVIHALNSGHFDVAEVLVDAGCRVSCSDGLADRGIQHPLNYAIRSGRLGLLRKMVESPSGRVLLGKHMARSNLPVTLAITEERTDMLRLLVENGSLLDCEYNGPLSAAITRGDADTVRYLLDHGAKPLLSNDAFSLALSRANEELASMLLDYTNIKLLGLREIRTAVGCGKRGFIKKAIAKGLNLKTWGTACLCAAIEFDQEDIFDMFMDAGCPVYQPDQDNPLDTAITQDRKIFIRKLLEADQKSSERCKMITIPYITLCKKGDLDIVQLLIEQGAPVDGELGTGDIGYTPLGAASLEGHVDVVKYLIKKGADVNYVPSGKDTALYCACVGGHEDVVDLLQMKTATPTAHGKEKGLRSPLVAAIENGKYNIVSSLVKAGYNIKEKPSYLKSVDAYRFPLARAAELGLDGIVEYLIKEGADVNETFYYYDYECPPALWLATKEGKHEVVKLLLKAGADFTVTDHKNGMPLLFAAMKGCYRAPRTFSMPKDKEKEVFVKTIEILLAAGCDVGQRARDVKESLLMYAIIALPSGSELIKRIALNRGPLNVPLHLPEFFLKDSRSAGNKEQKEEVTPMYFASRLALWDTMKILMDCGVSLADEDFWIHGDLSALAFMRADDYEALKEYDQRCAKKREKSNKREAK